MIKSRFVILGINAEGKKLYYDEAKEQLYKVTDSVPQGYWAENKGLMAGIMIAISGLLGMTKCNMGVRQSEFYWVLSFMVGIIVGILCSILCNRIEDKCAKGYEPYEPGDLKEWQQVFKCSRKYLKDIIWAKTCVWGCVLLILFMFKDKMSVAFIFSNFFMWGLVVFLYARVSVRRMNRVLKKFRNIIKNKK